jgi:alkanesulfonate monooxygenase SsuD/methylene tetrahydromethanopterin reductase-like flavin-dependent oxidoreductase (luciferase family)
MRFGVAVPTYGESAEGNVVHEFLLGIEELGFESAWFPDHVAVPDYAADVNLRPPFLEPLATCAWGVGVTQRLRFGTDVLVAAYRHPLLVAAMAGTIGRLAADRLTLGIGIGYLRGEFEVLDVGPYESRAAVTDTFLRSLRTPPTGFSVVAPTKPAPVWVGGNGPAARRRAAHLGDGWHPLWMPDTTYAEARREILAIRESAGLSDPFTFSYSGQATRVLTRLPDSWPAPRPQAPAGSEFAYAPPSWVAEDGRPRLVGVPDQIVSDLRLLSDAGVDHITLRFGTTELAQLERFAAEVMPAFVD